ncbi:MAG: ABC transporter permease, partial [Anaerolineae bacterium]|nr:ABC transporter permease [Anaerolineae bacterium]
SVEIVDLGVREHEGESLTRLALRRLRQDYLTLVALMVLLAFALLSLFAPLITDVLNVSYRTTSAKDQFLPLGTNGHLLGTDDLGRDHLARLLYGGRVSLSIALVAALASTFIGVTIGLIAGYYQGGRFGFVDDLIMWFITTLNSIPSLLLLILLGSVLSPSVNTLVLTLTLISWSGTMRLVRGETLSHREREYVVSARAVGAGPIRIMFTHILPNVFSVMVISLALGIGTLILVESALSFLGLGVRPPTPSWGNMLTDAQSSFRQAAYLSIIPGLLIATTVLCFYVIGDGLRDAFDPQAVRK